MADPRHPVSVRTLALVQTEQLQTFAISVGWSDDSDTFVRRSWDEFKTLHKTLKETFPVEAGLLRRSDRVLPKLRDAPLLVRGGRTGRGLARLRLLETYSRALLAAAGHVSRSPVLVGFFAPQPLDLEPTLPPGSLVILPAPEEPPPRPPDSLAIRSLEAQSLRCLQPFSTQDTRGQPFQARAQEALDVLLRHPSGWWLVANEDQQTAWFPAPYLEAAAEGRERQAPGSGGTLPVPSSAPKSPTTSGQPAAKPGHRKHLSKMEAREHGATRGWQWPQSVYWVPTTSWSPGLQFCAARAYESSHEDELSVPAGARVRVLETSDRGWWLCRFGGRSGLLPAVLLRPEGLGALLSRSGLHREADGEEVRVGAAQGSPEAPQATTLPPTVPARPTLSAIQSRCCTITRRALVRKDPLEGVWKSAEGKPSGPDPAEG